MRLYFCPWFQLNMCNNNNDDDDDNDACLQYNVHYLL